MSDAIFHLMIGVGNACNLQCKHCYREETEAFASELTFDELGAIMAEQAGICRARGMQGLVTFSGGEPLMRADLAALIRLARLYFLAPRVLTNGVLLNDARVAMLKEAGVGMVQVSLDGANAETHDAIRGKGRFLATTAGIRRLVEAGIYTDLKVTLMPGHNEDQIGEFFALANALGAHKISFGRLVPIGAGASLEARQSPEAYRALIEELVAHARRSPHTRMELREPTYDRSYLYPDSHAYAVMPEVASFSIDSDGTVYPNRRLPTPLGNIRETSLEALFDHSLVAAIRDRRFTGACAGCELLATCGGGSRASAFGLSGDPLGTDPDCWYAAR